MQEIRARAVPGVLGLLLMLLLAAGGPFLFIRGVMSTTGDAVPVTTPVLDIILAVLMMLAAVAIGTGLVVVQPNVSRSLIFFGRYAGTLREPGFWLALPLTSKPAVVPQGPQLRKRHVEGQRLPGQPHRDRRRGGLAGGGRRAGPVRCGRL